MVIHPLVLFGKLNGTTESGQRPAVKPWIVVKSSKKGSGPVYRRVIMPSESHGFIKARRFDFL